MDDRRDSDADHEESQPARRRATIMVIEDHTDTLEFLCVMLGDRYETEVCNSAVEALRRCAERRPDLVLCDLLLNESTGWDFIRECRERFDGIPVVAVTAHVVQGVKEKALAAGFNDFIAKPILDLAVLQRTIDRLLHQSRRGQR
jgi:CheY-like chemotaxis protein